MSATPITRIGIGSFIAPIHPAAASIDCDPREFQHLSTGSYVHARVCPIDGNPGICLFRVTGGTYEFPSEMTAEMFRGSVHSRGVFKADLVEGGPRIWVNEPVPGRNQLIGTLTTTQDCDRELRRGQPSNGSVGGGPSMGQSAGGSVGGGSYTGYSAGGSTERGSDASTLRGGTARPR